MRTFILLLTVFSTFSLASQNNTDPWNTLALVDKKSKFDDMMGMIVETARPQAPAMALNGQEIEIKGFIIALAAKSELKHFMFSRYPQNMCFFCGAAGPESAMQVFLKEGKTLDYTSDKVLLKGKLNIQSGDPSGLIYTLKDTELIEIIKS
jgi:hypothetical protein